MPGWISPWELFILLFVAILFFGPKRLPEIGRSLGKGIRELKDSLSKDERGPKRLPAPEEKKSS